MTIDEFKKIELRVGTILSAERVEGSEKLLKFTVDVGEKNETGENVPRQILAGLGKNYTPEEMAGRQIVVVANLDYRNMMGMTSQGMILAATNEEGAPIVLTLEKKVQPGAEIK